MCAVERRLAEVFGERLPIHFVPTALEHVMTFVWVAGVIEDHFGVVTVCLKFEAGDRIKTVLPVASAPSLHNTFSWNEFDVARGNLAAEQ